MMEEDGVGERAEEGGRRREGRLSFEVSAKRDGRSSVAAFGGV